MRFNKKAKRLLIYAIIWIVVTLVVIIFRKQLFSAFIVILLIIIASASKIYKRFSSISLGFELVTPITILFAYKINVFFAVFSAIIMLILSSFIAGKFDFPGMFMEIGVYIVISLITFVFSFMTFASIATGMIILRNAMLLPLGILVLGRSPVQIGIVVVSNIVINIAIIAAIGNNIVNLL